MQEMGVRVILAGVRRDLLDGLRAAGAMDHLQADQVFSERQKSGSSTMEAVAAAYAYLQAGHLGSDPPLSLPRLAHFQV
jgi:hypothetical protein